jgi:hypothetical protein
VVDIGSWQAPACAKVEAMPGHCHVNSAGRLATTSGYPVSVTQRAERTSPAAKCCKLQLVRRAVLVLMLIAILVLVLVRGRHWRYTARPANYEESGVCL